FQLLAQVAGRAGRGEKGGQVMIQTFTPDHPCITLAANHDFVSFAGQELIHRKQHQYPPFHRLARLIVPSEKEEAAAEFAETLAGAFHEAVKRVTLASGGREPPVEPQSEETGGSRPPLAQQAPPVRILGPAECPVFRLNSFYRFHFQVQS